MITNEQRIEKLRTLPEKIQEQYGSLETATFITELNEKYDLPHSGPVVNVIGDTILGFHQIRDLSGVLITEIKVSKETSEIIAKEITNYLESGTHVKIETPITNQSPVKPGSSLPTAQKPDLKERLRLRPEGTKMKEEAFKGPESRPLTREELLKSLTTTRTMAKDIEAAKGVVGQQPAGSQEAQNKTDTTG